MNIDLPKLDLKKAAQPASAAERVPVASGRAEQRDKQTPPLPEATQAVARQIEAYLRSQNKSLEFRVDADSGRTIVSVRDSETGELIRQIPGDEVLRIAQAMKELTALLDVTA